MRKLIKRLLTKPVSTLAARYSSRPEKELVHQALTNLYNAIVTGNSKKGLVLPFSEQDRFIVLSDMHKGAKDGSDDFSFAERSYNCALNYYYSRQYTFINLGDSEELWENNILSVKKYHPESFSMEKRFLQRKAFIKIFGNHDLYWDNDPLAPLMLESIFGEKVKIFEGVVLQTSVSNQSVNIFLTHGHQGDKQSDGNWFSKWFVANVWAPLQMYLELNLNTPSTDNQLKTDHNRFMYEWVGQQKNLLLITGHTHQPVFVSLTFLERLYNKLHKAKRARDAKAIEELEAQIAATKIKEGTDVDFSTYQPTYFNTGCCCFSDGDITGIEIAEGMIRLIKWEYDEREESQRSVLEEISLKELMFSSIKDIKESLRG